MEDTGLVFRFIWYLKINMVKLLDIFLQILYTLKISNIIVFITELCSLKSSMTKYDN